MKGFNFPTIDENKHSELQAAYLNELKNARRVVHFVNFKDSQFQIVMTEDFEGCGLHQWQRISAGQVKADNKGTLSHIAALLATYELIGHERI